MVEIGIATPPGGLLSGGARLFGLPVSAERPASDWRAGFPRGMRGYGEYPQFTLSGKAAAMVAGKAVAESSVTGGTNQQQLQHVVTDVPTGLPPSARERRH